MIPTKKIFEQILHYNKKKFDDTKGSGFEVVE